MNYHGFGYIVDSCPVNETEQRAAARRLNCGVDQYRNSQYVCAPNAQRTAIVEYCYSGTVGLQNPGTCLKVYNDGSYDAVSCTNFKKGCTTDYFNSANLYKYPACHQINTQDRCYYEDPTCPNMETTTFSNETFTSTPRNLSNITDTTFNSTMNTAIQSDDNVLKTILTGSFAGVLVLVLAIFLFWIVRLRQRNRARKDGQSEEEISNELERFINADTDIRRSTSPIGIAPQLRNYRMWGKHLSEIEPGFGDYSLLKKPSSVMSYEPERFINADTDSRSSTLTIDYSVWKTPLSELELILGDYSVWKTPLSDQFSSLSDDEVYVLFCFLCSDSGTPDFTDADGLDFLNEIRRMMYGKKNSVTSEEAQRTLDGLKSRGFLWDQDGVDITEDAKDETMYRVTESGIERSVPVLTVHSLSSYTTAVRYLRSQRYTRKSGEKCVITDGSLCDSLLIHRLQMNILTHVTMEDTSICDEVSRYLHVPTTILKNMTFDQRQEFIRNLEHNGECVHYRGGSQGSVQHIKWLWRNRRPDIVRSCIGLHPHLDIYIINNKAYRKHSKYHEYPDNVRSRLYCLLLAEEQTVNTKGHKQQDVLRKIRERYFTELALSDDVHMRNLPDDIIQTQDEIITFKSNDIRHDVMYAFVTECLVEDSDLKFFLTTASRDVISEYCRSWDYKRGEGERCLYIPRKPVEMYELFIDRLQLDILTHCTVSDVVIHNRISERLGVPGEILDWDQEGRERYVEYAKRGTQTVHHARGMIVGCAGAGKTTLLKRLLRCSDAEIRDVTSTEGLEVHEEIFQICEETKTLKVRSKDIGGKKNSNETDEKTVTFFDFGGQCAYYACHQIYLTRRAFYMVVVDASKRLDQVVDKKVCDQADTVFAGWTYGEYFIFWLKSVHTYCSTRDGQRVEMIIVASHWENTVYTDKVDFLNCLLEVIPAQSDLAQYIRTDRCFLIQFPPNQPIAELERCIIDLTTHSKWSEKIPHEWVFLNSEISEKKPERIVPISDIHERLPVRGHKKIQSAADMLRYYHDAGRVLYFNEKGLKYSVITDVQWFVNAFKTIITDSLHVSGYTASRQDWIEYYNTGNLKDSLLVDIWELQEKNINTQNKKADSEHGRGILHHKGSMLKYMERLGLLAVGPDLHYVPCMNKKKFQETQKKFIQESTPKTSVLVYAFDFLPYFLFYRVVVACMQISKWEVLKNNDIKCLYKNAAMFKYEDHYVVIFVTPGSIQLQIIRRGGELIRDITVAIRQRIDQILIDVTETFHKHLSFRIGHSCMEEQDQIIGLEIEGRFLEESELGSGKNVKCPHHEVEDYHTINADYLKGFWK